MFAKKFTAISSALALFFALTLLSVPNTASAATINVPTDEPTLHEAVAAADPGDEIVLGPGPHNLPSQLVIDKDLTITGSGKNTTIITTSFNTTNSGAGRGMILVTAGNSLDISDLTINGIGQNVWQGIRHVGDGGSVDNVHFTELKFPTYNGTGIAIFGTGPVNVTNSDFTGIGRIGVHYFGSGVNGSVYDNNTYTGKGDGDWLDYALDIGNGADVTVSNSSISDNRGVATSDGSHSAGVLVTTFFGPGTGALIENNDLTDNAIGIAVGFDESDSSDVNAHLNSIEGNEFGVISTAATVDATCNWWGDVSGPGGEGMGNGDTVSENVLFDPWLLAENGGCGSLPESKDDCKDEGWQTLFDDMGNPFKNQGDCVSFFVTNGNNKANG